MRTAFVLAALVAVAAAKAVQMELNLEAVEVHPERQSEIDRINSRPNTLWRAGANPRFAHKAPGAARSLCGVLPTNSETTRKLVEQGHVHEAKITARADLPKEFDSAANWPQCAKAIADVRDQSDCGCCWAFGAAGAASDRLCIATNASILLPLSAQNMCFCAHNAGNGCFGGELAPAWQYVAEHGLVTGGQNKGIGPFGKGFCSEFSLPHCHHHGPQGSDPYPDEGSAGCPSTQQNPACPSSCDSTAVAPHNSFSQDQYSFKGRVVTYKDDADVIATAIMEGGPVEVAFTVYSDFENYVSGIYHHTGGQMLGGHAVKLVGWGEENGEKYWKVMNSWNPYWGEKGYFRIRRGNDECGIESDVVSADNSAKWGKL